MATLGLTHLWTFARILFVARSAPATPASFPALAILGNRLNSNGSPSRDFRQRLEHGLLLWRTSGPFDILVIGGAVSSELSEAGAGQTYLQEHGVESAYIHQEATSLNTLENFRHARAWFAGFPSAGVVSNRYHLARVLDLARGLGLQVQPCAAENKLHFWRHWHRWLLETMFLHWYWSGRWYAQLTGNRRMLEKISVVSDNQHSA
ncbi:conserved hypothetical protein [Thiolapillus brandeum]|uniref:DUF218 domain-containing protein n=1 Tax=Thiolapillus brandeum TaxID=1076588 RepID=A0A7U6GIT0_9GAMM|nr:conserved hypothetical protein [Thiolapillus brandeum]